ncbi:HNH endonuclease [Stenotrophomonas forensis]
MTSKTLKSLRARSFRVQNGGCYYCGVRMWSASPDELGLRSRSARPFQCTAEHLVARQDGGKDTAENVVAACHRCNQRRHKRQAPAPSPHSYLCHVRKRMAKGTWHPAHPAAQQARSNRSVPGT